MKVRKSASFWAMERAPPGVASATWCQRPAGGVGHPGGGTTRWEGQGHAKVGLRSTVNRLVLFSTMGNRLVEVQRLVKIIPKELNFGSLDNIKIDIRNYQVEFLLGL